MRMNIPSQSSEPPCLKPSSSTTPQGRGTASTATKTQCGIPLEGSVSPRQPERLLPRLRARSAHRRADRIGPLAQQLGQFHVAREGSARARHRESTPAHVDDAPSENQCRNTPRARSRGAAMVEAIVVISVFILFFVGMVYFESLYHEQLRALQLARAAAVAYAMDACPDNTDPLRTVRRTCTAPAVRDRLNRLRRPRCR